MTTMFFIFSLFNFLILFGSIFYIMDIRPTMKRLFLCLVVNTIVALLANAFLQSLWISMISSVVLGGGLFYLFTRQRMAYIHLIIIQITGMLTEYIALFIIDNFFDRSLAVHGTLIIVQMVLFVLLYKKILLHYKGQILLPTRSYIVLLLIASATFLVFYNLIFVPSEIGNVEISGLNIAILLSYFVIMIGLSGILLYMMMKEYRLHSKMVEQQQFSQYMQALEQVNRDMQTFRHDYSNILLSLRGYIENQDMKGLTTYFHEHILKVEEHTLFRHEIFSQLDRLEIIEVKGIIATKILKADGLSIPVWVEVPDRIRDISMERIHLSRVMGILLDNAIEASIALPEPKIHLAFITIKEQVIIVIENRTANSELLMNQLYEEGYSTKGEHRGFGLSTVKNILSGYPNVMFNSRMENQTFIHEIIIEGRGLNEGNHM